jgi:hypothetical protein
VFGVFKKLVKFIWLQTKDNKLVIAAALGAGVALFKEVPIIEARLSLLRLPWTFETFKQDTCLIEYCIIPQTMQIQLDAAKTT